MSIDRRWLALYILCGSLLMIVLDATIVNVALNSGSRRLVSSQPAISIAVDVGARRAA
jgi:hypothetical protein